MPRYDQPRAVEPARLAIRSSKRSSSDIGRIVAWSGVAVAAGCATVAVRGLRNRLARHRVLGFDGRHRADRASRARPRRPRSRRSSRRMRTGCFAIALRVLGDPHDAEEVAQDALVRAYRALAGYGPDRIRELRLRPWLATIVANLCRNRLRRRPPAQLRCSSRSSRRVSSRPPPGADPAALADRRAEQERLAAAVLGLPDRYRRPSCSVTSTGCPMPSWRSPSTVPRAPSRPRSTAAWRCCARRSRPPRPGARGADRMTTIRSTTPTIERRSAELGDRAARAGPDGSSSR